MTEKTAKPEKARATLADGKKGLEALKALAKAAKPAPSAADRLAAARADRKAKVEAVLTKDVLAVVTELRTKGYGWGVIANTLADMLDSEVKVSASMLKDICQPKDRMDKMEAAAKAPFTLDQSKLGGGDKLSGGKAKE